MRAIAAIAILAVYIYTPASEARVRAGPGTMESSGHRLRQVVAPLQGFTTPMGAYGLRLLRQAYLTTGPAIRLRRTSDNAESDFGFSGSGGLDLNAATAFCAATSCFVAAFHDQSGNLRHLLQTGASGQPALVFDCVGVGRPCLRFDTGAQFLVTGGPVTPLTGTVTLNVVSRRVSGANVCVLLRETAANQFVSAAGQVVLQAGGVNIHFATAADGAWHTGTGIVAGPASSIVRVDAAETSNSTGGTDVAAASMGMVGAAATVCQVSEAIVWDNYVLTAAERASLTANQRAYWGF